MGGACDDDNGSVARADVISVLRCHGVEVVESNGATTLISGEIPEVNRLPDRLHRHMLHRLSRRFNVPVHHFFHPEMIISKETPKA